MGDFFKKDKLFRKKDFMKMDPKFEPRTVVVQSKDGTIREYDGITDPWRYIKKCKKSINVKNAWIKE